MIFGHFKFSLSLPLCFLWSWRLDLITCLLLLGQTDLICWSADPTDPILSINKKKKKRNYKILVKNFGYFFKKNTNPKNQIILFSFCRPSNLIFLMSCPWTKKLTWFRLTNDTSPTQMGCNVTRK